MARENQLFIRKQYELQAYLSKMIFTKFQNLKDF